MTTSPQTLIRAQADAFQNHALETLQRTDPTAVNRLHLRHAPLALATAALLTDPKAFVEKVGLLATFGYTASDIPALREALLESVRTVCADLPLDEVLPAERSIIAAAKELDPILTTAPIAQRGEVVQVERRSRRITVVRILCEGPTQYTPGQFVYINPHFAPGQWEAAYPSIPANEAGQLEVHIFHDHSFGSKPQEAKPDEAPIADAPIEATDHAPQNAEGSQPQGAVSDDQTAHEFSRPAASQAQLARLRPGDTCLISTGQGVDPQIARNPESADQGSHERRGDQDGLDGDSDDSDAAPSEDLLFISHGTALAPVRAMLLALMSHANPPRTHVFVSADYPGEQYELGTLWQIAGTCPWLSVTPVVRNQEDAWWVAPTEHSRPPRGLHLPQTGEPGAVVASYGKWLDRTIFIAGTDAEINASRQALLNGGTPADAIHTISTSRRYFWEH